MELWQATVLGIVQGITEFLPISSTAHLLLVQEWWFGISRENLQTDPFTVVIQLGTLFAVLAYFRNDIVRMLYGLTRDLATGCWMTSKTAESRLAKYILVGTLPAGVAGLLFKKLLKDHFYNAPAIGAVSVVFALLMFAAEWWARHRPRRDHDSITFRDSLFIGVFQALALMPGGSRSGCTLTAGLFAGLSRPAAARFSFLLSLPIMLAAGVKELYDWFKAVKGDPILREQATAQLVPLAVGTIVSAIVGYAAIAWLLAFLRNSSMNVFVIYRLLLGATIIILAATKVIPW